MNGAQQNINDQLYVLSKTGDRLDIDLHLKDQWETSSWLWFYFNIYHSEINLFCSVAFAVLLAVACEAKPGVQSKTYYKLSLISTKL